MQKLLLYFNTCGLSVCTYRELGLGVKSRERKFYAYDNIYIDNLREAEDFGKLSDFVNNVVHNILVESRQRIDGLYYVCDECYRDVIENIATLVSEIASSCETSFTKIDKAESLAADHVINGNGEARKEFYVLDYDSELTLLKIAVDKKDGNDSYVVDRLNSYATDSLIKILGSAVEKVVEREGGVISIDVTNKAVCSILQSYDKNTADSLTTWLLSHEFSLSGRGYGDVGDMLEFSYGEEMYRLDGSTLLSVFLPLQISISKIFNASCEYYSDIKDGNVRLIYNGPEFFSEIIKYLVWNQFEKELFGIDNEFIVFPEISIDNRVADFLERGAMQIMTEKISFSFVFDYELGVKAFYFDNSDAGIVVRPVYIPVINPGTISSKFYETVMTGYSFRLGAEKSNIVLYIGEIEDGKKITKEMPILALSELGGKDENCELGVRVVGRDPVLVFRVESRTKEIPLTNIIGTTRYAALYINR